MSVDRNAPITSKPACPLPEVCSFRLPLTSRFQPSFYKRSLMYNVYYRLCIQLVGADDAERMILHISETPIVPARIVEADARIESLYDPDGNEQQVLQARARRDRAKVEVLEFVLANETDPFARRKLESVIQELVHDIELWEF